jgi:hypothetical protein
MRKCSHGIYWPDNQPLAYGCGFCNPKLYDEADIPPERVPVFEMRSRHDPETPWANNIPCKSRCPECDSNVHFVDLVAKVWECADCGHKWKGRVKE